MNKTFQMRNSKILKRTKEQFFSPTSVPVLRHEQLIQRHGRLRLAAGRPAELLLQAAAAALPGVHLLLLLPVHHGHRAGGRPVAAVGAVAGAAVDAVVAAHHLAALRRLALDQVHVQVRVGRGAAEMRRNGTLAFIHIVASSLTLATPSSAA